MKFYYSGLILSCKMKLKNHLNIMFHLKLLVCFLFCLNGFSNILKQDKHYQTFSPDSYTGIISILSNAISKVPDNIGLLLERGDTFLFYGKFQSAISDFTNIIQIDPKHDHALTHRGLASLMLKNYEKAKDDFDKAIQINPKNLPLYMYRGHTRFMLKNYKQSISDIETFLAENPAVMLAHKYLLDAKEKLWEQNLKNINRLCQIKKFDQALSLGKATIQLANALFSPQSANKQKTIKAYSNICLDIAQMCTAEKQFKNAEKYFLIMKENILENNGSNDPEIGNVYFYMGEMHDKNNQLEKAMICYEKTFHIFNRHELSVSKLIKKFIHAADYYFENGSNTKASKLYQRILNINRKNYKIDQKTILKILYRMAEILKMQEKSEELESLYQKILEINEFNFGEKHPDIVKDLQNLGRFYLYNQEYKDAETYFKRTISILEKEKLFTSSDYTESLKCLIILYEKSGNLIQAAEIKKKLKTFEQTNS